MSYDNVRLTASHEPSYEDPRLTGFTYSILKILCKHFSVVYIIV